MKLVLIRHGESIWNQQNLFTGWSDVGLTEKGVQEAILAGQLLKDANFDFDVSYTSYLKRAIDTQNRVLEHLDREWLPVVKSWKLNERHYGALQGLNKAETSAQYGEEQVNLWRRSYDVQPPALDAKDERCPQNSEAYRKESKDALPLCESLKDTIERVVPYFEIEIKPRVCNQERVLIVAHGNSIRALVMYLEHLTPEEIAKVNIPTGVPLVYELSDAFEATKKYYLGNEQEIARSIESVANQALQK